MLKLYVRPMFYTSIVVALALLAPGCGPKEAPSVEKTEAAATISPEPVGAGRVVPRELYTYQFKVNSCDTRVRIAISKTQLCRNLQIDSQNGGCAEAEREDYFASRCLDEADWSPTLFPSDATLKCTIRPTNAAVDDFLWGSAYVVQQDAYSGEDLYMAHDDFIVQIRHTASGRYGERYNATVRILDQDWKIVAEQKKIWDSADPTKGITLTYAPLNAEVTCSPMTRGFPSVVLPGADE